MRKSAVVVVPIYKIRPSTLEIVSAKRLSAVLGSHDIVFVAPHRMDCSWYTSTVRASSVETFPEKYFQSVVAYNRMLLSRRFYRRFDGYDYMLVYQLDAYVFRDELALWCDKEYDYIGAPWFQGWARAADGSAFVGVGNGGFSLRKIDAMLHVLSTLRTIESFRHIASRARSGHDNVVSAAISALISYAMKNNTHSYFNGFKYNEDAFWGLVVPSLFKGYKVAGYEDAAKFSFETRPSYLYQLNGAILPFGCHAWMKYEPDFWREHISMS